MDNFKTEFHLEFHKICNILMKTNHLSYLDDQLLLNWLFKDLFVTLKLKECKFLL